MDDSDKQTICAVLFLAGLTVAAYPGELFGLDVYTPLLLLVLGFFGIQGIMMMRGLRVMELLPGILSNKEIIGITGIVSITWLYMNAVMAYDQYMALLMMILSALGIMHLHAKSLRQ